MSNTPLNTSEGDGLFTDSTTGDVRLIKDGIVLATFNRATGNVDFLGEMGARNVLFNNVAYDDFQVKGLEIGKGASAPDLEDFRGGMLQNAFTGTGVTTQQGFFSIDPSHRIEPGTIPTFHVHWAHNIAVPSGNVKWLIDCTVVEPEGVYGDPVTVSVVQAVGTQYQHVVTDDTAMPLSETPGVEAIILGRIYRDPTDAADTFEDDAFLFQISLHYQIGKLGTYQSNIGAPL